MSNKKSGTNWRLGAVVAVIIVASLVLVLRLAQLQILDHGRYAAEARLTHLSQETLSGRRGALLDRNGYPLAASQDNYDVMVEKRAWKNPQRAQRDSQALAAIVGRPPEEELGLNGVRLLRSSHRVYPEGNLAAQLLGFVGRDNVGLTGLEADLDPTLGGNKGSLTFERDGRGQQLALGERREVPPQPGADIVLTIDRYIQRLAEQELDKAIEKHEASGGTIIVVQPKTGEILALASRPTFDLTKPDLSDQSKLALFRNRAITDQYEPGSVFKLVTAAAALDQGLVSPDTRWYDSGVVHASGWSIYNWDFSANGSQTVTQILSKSLNTGAAWLSQQLGPDRFYDYVARFGFGQLSDSVLGGEVAGRVRTPANDPDNWRPVDAATNSFGQGISVTPLQMAMALAAIANDGKLMKPQLVREAVTPSGRQPQPPQEVRQVISPETARTLRQMMGVVVKGIPTSFLNVQGYQVGGKTGTANIVTEDGGYKPNAYISSFVGIAPLDDPVLAVLVKIDEPKGVPWGTVVAAPAFSRIAQAALAHFKVPPQEPALVSEIQ